MMLKKNVDDLFGENENNEEQNLIIKNNLISLIKFYIIYIYTT